MPRKDVEQIPDVADDGGRGHDRDPRITGNATITGAMGTGVSASRDCSKDKPLWCHASNGEIFMVSYT